MSNLPEAVVTWRENIERVRAGIKWSRDGRDEQRQALVSLTALTAQIEELERERSRLLRFAREAELVARDVGDRAEELEARMKPVFDAALQLNNAREGEEDERLDALFAALAQSDPPASG